MFGAFPLWARARSGRNSALFHVEHFPFRLPFPNCSTWNKTLHHPSNSDPTTPLSSSIRSESQNGPLRSRPLSRPHLPPWRTLRPYLPAHHPGSSRPGALHPSLRLWLLLQHHHPAGRFPSSSRRTDNRHLSLSVSATAEDSIGPARTGLPYKKSPINECSFSPRPQTPTSSAFSSVSSQVPCASEKTPST